MKPLTCLAAVLTGWIAGCSPQPYSTRGDVNTEPLIVDAAMQQRDWDVTHAYYQNGSTLNWSTGFAYVPKPDMPNTAYSVADTGTFLINVLTSPYTFFTQSGGVVSGGVAVPPSYTAVPPLPPTNVPLPTTQPAE